MTTSVSWRDETNHRIVKFSVAWTIDSNHLEIRKLTAKQVTFICPASNSIIRSAGIHTASGRELLSDAFIAAGKLEVLINEIAERNNLSIVSNL